MSGKIVLLRRAQNLCREARQIRVDAGSVLLSEDRQFLTELAVLLEAEAVKLELRAESSANALPNIVA